jgi:hypothetical protein
MVAVQTAVIAFLANTGVPAVKIPLYVAHVTICCFVVSILAAAWVLSAIPYIMIQLCERNDSNIYLMNISSAPILRLIPLWLMATIQHLFFFLGILAVGLSPFFP